MRFSVNDQLFEEYVIPRYPKNLPLLPHISTRNIKFSCNFGVSPSEFKHDESYLFLNVIKMEQGLHTTQKMVEDETEKNHVIMLCGLPKTGKSAWATAYTKKHPNRRFQIINHQVNYYAKY